MRKFNSGVVGFRDFNVSYFILFVFGYVLVNRYHIGLISCMDEDLSEYVKIDVYKNCINKNIANTAIVYILKP